MDSFNEVFQNVQAYSKERVAPVTYDLFFADLEPVIFENNTAILRTRSEFIRGVLEERYSTMLRDGFAQILGFDVEIKYQIKEEDPAPLADTPTSGISAYTFENFVVGANNKFAHAAALSVAANPSRSYNPLFIYGESGLGKTHLLFAIRHAIEQKYPGFSITYVDGETFTNEIIKAIQDKTMNEFHNKYRTGDVLLVDDVQFIGGKESTQEEFFHTFNTLYNAGKQILLASDRPPKEIKSLDERLRTRFEWGLTADIQPPDFETRVAIIRRKAAQLNFDLPDDVSEYIANNLKNNIRQLEGTVKKLNALYLLEGIQPVVGVAKTTIKDIMNERPPLPVTIEKITSEVARTYNVSVDDIRGRKRNSSISTARMVAMYCVRDVTGISVEDIGAEFGGRDHSTVVYATNTISSRMQTDIHMRETIEDIIKNVKG